MATLTPKQEKFCQNVAVKSMTYSDAYRDAYNAENMKDSTINRKAYEVVENGNVSARIDVLKKKTEEAVIKEAVYDYKEHMAELEEIRALSLSGQEGKKELNVATKVTELKGKASELYNFTQKVNNVGAPQVVVNNTKDAEALNELSSK